jgi:F0F1-type ATP synthase assembly protein I
MDNGLRGSVAVPKPERSFIHMVGQYSALATLLPASTFAGYVIGYLLDKLFNTHFLYLVFLLLGIASGFIKLIQQLQKDTRENGG